MENAERSPEGTPICPRALLHLGSRAAVDQALSRLSRAQRLIRVCRGVYVRPVETRFGVRAPSVERVIAALSVLWGETIVPCGGAAAQVLGLTTQIPIRSVYLTSGPGRTLRFLAQEIQLRHAPRWQLVAPGKPSGRAIRALAWLGPEEIGEGIDSLAPTLCGADFAELAQALPILPSWIAEPVSALLARG